MFNSEFVCVCGSQKFQDVPVESRDPNPMQWDISYTECTKCGRRYDPDSGEVQTNE